MNAFTTNLDKLKPREDLFKEVKYFVTGNLDAKIDKLLKEGGASCCNYLVTSTTHLLCGEGFDESEIAQASDLYEIPSVTEAWVIASAKLGRLAITKPYDPTPNSKCFSQVFACITQVTSVDRYRLYALITFNGGVVERNFTARTTHLICGLADGPAYAKAITIKNDNFCVVTPDWIIDSLNGQELRDPQMYHPRLLIVSQQDSVAIKSTPTVSKPNVVSMIPTTTATSNTEKQSLSSILGFDFEENIEKSDIPIQRDVDVANAEKSAAASMTSQINSILQSVSASPSSSTLLTSPQQTQQRLQPNQNMAMMQQRQSISVNQVEQPNKVSGQSPQHIRNSQAIATNASVQQQITAINQQHQYNQQQKLLSGNSGTLNRSVSEIATSTVANSNNNSPATSGPEFLRQQSQQSHQILTQAPSNNKPLQNVQIVQQVGQSQMQQQLTNQTNQPQQQIIISQNNQVITQKHIINTSTAQGQQIIQQTRQSHLMSQQQRQQSAQNANILVNQQSQQAGGLIIGTNPNQPKQQIQFIQTAGGQQQVKIIQQQQHVMTGQHINKPLVQGQTQQRIIISQQQFNQLNQQQQQLLNNSQNSQNIVIINQQQPQSSGGQQIINQQQVGQQVQVNNNNVTQGQATQQQVSNQQMMLQKPVTNIQSPQAQSMQQIDQQSPQHQNASSPQNQQQQMNAQRMQSYLQQQQTIQQINNIKMQLQQQAPGISNSQQPQTALVTTQNQQSQQQLLQSPSIQSTSQQVPSVPSSPQQAQQQQQQSQQQIIPTQQKIQQIQNQIIVQQQPGMVQSQNANILVNQWTPQSPVQQGQSGVGQPPQQFIRTQRPQQWPPQAGNQPQRQLIHLDAATHAHLQTLDPIRRAEYLTKLQQKQRERSLMLRQQAFQGRPNAPNIVAGQRPPGAQHIIVRTNQIVPTQQQQLQWLQQVQQQQNVRQPLLVSQSVRGGAPGLSPISQTVSPIPQQQQQYVDPNAQQQQLQQLQIQRQQQYQRLQIQQQQQQQNRPIQGQQPVSPRGFTSEVNQDLVTTPTTPGTPSSQQIQIGQDPNSQASMNSKTKTALANMLSNRLGNNGNVVPNIPETPTEPSAAGTLRLMTAQHNAALNQSINQSSVQRTPQELAVIQQQQQQQQQQVQQQAAQRRTLTNITNNAPTTPVANQIQIQPAAPVPVSHSPVSSIKPPFSPGRPSLQRPQFYGHNPNLKLPPALFLLGCTFFIVEYDETCEEMLPEWKELIQRHGGEIEQMYCPRVTHVLCRTQRHGVVMQAIRDSKRCITAYWLNDTVMKKQVVPPWQALHLPMPSTFGTQRPATRHIIGISGFEGEERVRIKNMIDESGAMLTTYLSRHNTVLICKKPDGPKYKRAKDWNIPVVNTVWLSDILLGNLSGMSQFETAKYQQYNITGPFRIDYGLVPHLMTAWKSPINLTQESHERVKRHNSEPQSEPKAKKIRTIPPLEEIPDEVLCTEPPEADKVPKIIFSQVDNIEGLTKAVKSLGGEVVESPSEATHLVVTRLVRSCKLLVALSVVDHILSSKWIVESAKAGKFLPVDGYEINDPKFKQTFKADVQKTITSSSRRSLFEGKTFFLTPRVRPSKTILTSMIESSGGRVDKNRLSAARISETNAQKAASYIVLSCAQDLHLLSDLMRPGRPNRIICSTEFVMSSVMTQNIDLERHVIKYS